MNQRMGSTLWTEEGSNINEMSYMTFASMELELRQCLHQNPNPMQL